MRRGETRADYAHRESAVLNDRDKITDRAAANESVGRIAREYGIDRRTLARILDGWSAARRRATRDVNLAQGPCKRR
ncbi:hypothetical protein [Streptomyces sp. NPDC088744]|uniref:hypothetical protein n=1 Tax=Streptomyces sp. NPDC088744 TaxID=3155061 RepID=UPI00344FE013